ncbi:MAG: 30S ribosomal protein S2 [Actinobacteria bacterium]|nr:30S ribosomal protein S2 [Actinomycetota bacterium]
MPAATMKQLLESGVHFGHQTRRWNPKMKPYIFADRGGIHIIDLQKTTKLLDRAYEITRNISERGGSVLFVGTKKQCQDSIRLEASRVGMPFVSHRWLGGLLTNFSTIHARINRLHELRRRKADGSLALLPTKERMNLERELGKLEISLGGVADMQRLPDAVFIIDPKREAIATREVNKLGIPLIGLVDTNCDPDEADYLIPGNDDAIRSCSLIIKTIARAVEEGRQKVNPREFAAPEQTAEPVAADAAAAETAPAAEAAQAEAPAPADEAPAPVADAPAPEAPAPVADAPAPEAPAPVAEAPAAEADAPATPEAEA